MILLERFGALGGGAETLGGMVLMSPTSINYTGTSASIGANGSVTFTGCSNISLNGVFNTDYDNYVIVYRNASGDNRVSNLRLRASGTDNSTASSYVRQLVQAYQTSTGASRTTDNTFGQMMLSYSAVAQAGMTINMYGPFLAQPTAMRSVSAESGTFAYIEDNACTHNQSTSYDGFSIYTSASTTSGVISVYGLVGT